jgi:hypothetical protein
MSAVGFDTGGVDGRFGAQAEQAVKQLQQQSELGVDGVVGAKTTASLARRHGQSSTRWKTKGPQAELADEKRPARLGGLGGPLIDKGTAQGRLEQAGVVGSSISIFHQ